jgi:hypothetical protein
MRLSLVLVFQYHSDPDRSPVFLVHKKLQNKKAGVKQLFFSSEIWDLSFKIWILHPVAWLSIAPSNLFDWTISEFCVDRRVCHFL